jgi:hypothetical protein
VCLKGPTSNIEGQDDFEHVHRRENALHQLCHSHLRAPAFDIMRCYPMGLPLRVRNKSACEDLRTEYREPGDPVAMLRFDSKIANRMRFPTASQTPAIIMRSENSATYISLQILSIGPNPHLGK